MNNITISLIITLIAGLSTCIGIIPTYINDRYKDKIINFSLAFSSGVMITISFSSLIPEALHYLNNLNIVNILLVLIFINIGIILSIYIDKRLDKRISNNTLFKVGIVGIIAILLHNVFEGITTFITSYNELKIGIYIAIAIALHNIPEGISIAIPIYYSTRDRKLTFIYTFIAGFSEFIGGILSYIFLSRFINSFIMSIILSITAGIMIQISTYELLPTSIRYKDNIITYVGLFLGFIIMFITIFIFKI